jgi:hypothetical protein
MSEANQPSAGAQFEVIDILRYDNPAGAQARGNLTMLRRMIIPAGTF